VSGPDDEDEVFFGAPGSELPDWRDDEDASEDDDADDELPEGGFPADVAEMLGFDPSEESEESEHDDADETDE